MATALGTLLRNAGGTMNTVAYNASEYQRWTDGVAKVMDYLGIDTTKEFTINGVHYSKNENGNFESEMAIEAKTAYERLKANNMTYTFADERTKNQIEHMSRYYLADTSEEMMEAWTRTLEETGINPFAKGYPNSLIQLATEQDISTGGNDRIFGDTVESLLDGIERILERIDNPLAEADSDRLEAEKKFYSRLKENIMQNQ